MGGGEEGMGWEGERRDGRAAGGEGRAEGGQEEGGGGRLGSDDEGPVRFRVLHDSDKGRDWERDWVA